MSSSLRFGVTGFVLEKMHIYKKHQLFRTPSSLNITLEMPIGQQYVFCIPDTSQNRSK